MDIHKLAMDKGIRRMARETGISAGFVSQVFSGKTSVSLDKAAKLAKVLGVRLDDLYRHLQAHRVPRTPARLKNGPSAQSQARAMAAQSTN